MKWRMPGGGGIGGGAMTTAGNLVFQVLADGRLMAYSADKGEKLLELQTGLRSGMGPPITSKLDGKQYVALMGGVGQAAAGGNAGTGQPGRRPSRPKLLVFELGGKAFFAPAANHVGYVFRIPRDADAFPVPSAV